MFNKAKELATDAIKKNLEYSGSLTDIRKVSGLTMQEVNKLSTELAKIDTRTSVEGLAKLAYEGSKLGMSKYGVEGMASFVRAADKINVAIGEEMGEEALPALSKMVEVMGLIPKMGIEKAMDATGSAMFKLATTSTSTASDIVEFSKRLPGSVLLRLRRKGCRRQFLRASRSGRLSLRTLCRPAQSRCFPPRCRTLRVEKGGSGLPLIYRYGVAPLLPRAQLPHSRGDGI